MTIGSLAKSPATIIITIISDICSVSYTELKVLCVQTQFDSGISYSKKRRSAVCNTCFRFPVAWFYTVHIYTIQAQAVVNFPGKKLVEG